MKVKNIAINSIIIVLVFMGIVVMKYKLIDRNVESSVSVSENAALSNKNGKVEILNQRNIIKISRSDSIYISYS